MLHISLSVEHNWFNRKRSIRNMLLGHVFSGNHELEYGFNAHNFSSFSLHKLTLFTLEIRLAKATNETHSKT